MTKKKTEKAHTKREKNMYCKQKYLGTVILIYILNFSYPVIKQEKMFIFTVIVRIVISEQHRTYKKKKKKFRINIEI